MTDTSSSAAAAALNTNNPTTTTNNSPSDAPLIPPISDPPVVLDQTILDEPITSPDSVYSPKYIFFSELLILAPQIFAIFIVLLLKWKQEYCTSADLHTWALVYAIRGTIVVLLAYYIYHIQLKIYNGIILYRNYHLQNDSNVVTGNNENSEEMNEIRIQVRAEEVVDGNEQENRTDLEIPLLETQSNYGTNENNVADQFGAGENSRENIQVKLGMLKAQQAYALKLKNLIDNFGILWLVVGNFWLFQAHKDCLDTAPMIYYLDTALIYIGFTILLLPCIIMVLFFPMICLCFPCLVQILRRLNTKKPKGAKQSDIDKLPQIKYTKGVLSAKNIRELLQEHGKDENNLGNRRSNGAVSEVTDADFHSSLSRAESDKDSISNHSEAESDNASTSSRNRKKECAICLNNYKEDDILLLLPCEHHFHKACATKWLKINASCAVCRKSIL